MTKLELLELAAKAQAAYDSMTPSQMLRHNYMQRRSYVRGLCPDNTDFESHCTIVDKFMPHESILTDTEIGLILARTGRF